MKIYRTRNGRLMKRYAAASIIFAAITFGLAGCGRMADVGKDKAADIALADAKLSESDVTRLKVSKDTDDGKSIYEVEFTNGNTEYDYEILASNGEILSADYEESRNLDQQEQSSQKPQSDSQSQNSQQDTSDSQNQSSQQTQSGSHGSANHDHSGQASDSGADVQVSLEQASQLALDRVPGASAQDLKIELDYDDGYYKYEGDIIYNQKKYEFEIDADTGDFLEWKEERR